MPRPAVMEYMTPPLTQREYAKRVTQALVQAQYVAATMIDARHGARHKHLPEHQQRVEEEVTIIDEQRAENRLDYQAVAGRLHRLQRMIREKVPRWEATRETQETMARTTKRRIDGGYRQTRAMSESLAQEKDGAKSAVPHQAHTGRGGTSLERTRKRPLGQAQRDEGTRRIKDSTHRSEKHGRGPRPHIK